MCQDIKHPPNNLAKLPCGVIPRGMTARGKGLVDRLTPEQRLWVGRSLFFAGCVFLWRTAQTATPSTQLAAVGLMVCIAAIVSFTHLLRITPRLRPLMPWMVPVAAGALCNHMVVMANGGYMPVLGLSGPAGMHCAMEGARLTYLADWICGVASPGDVLLLLGAMGMVAMLMANRRESRELV